MTSERARFEVLLEEIRDMFKFLADGQVDTNRRLDTLEADVKSIKQEIFYVHPLRIVVQEHSETLHKHDKRLLKLEKRTTV